jgi:hypothetical protein
MFITIFPLTGMLGIDHLLLRSPLTAGLKILSSFISFFLTFIPARLLPFFIPLSFFWYFYDIAQACGESELIKKYGIAIPYYGPTGIGAGIFTGDPSIKESPKHIQRPWLFITYALTTFLFVGFPFNKFVIGDYEAGWFYTILCLLGIGFILSVPQGIYDIYNLTFDTKTVFETGFARIPGVAYFFKDYYTYTALGPNKQCSDNCDLSRVSESVSMYTAPLQAGVAAASLATTGAKLASTAANNLSQVVEAAKPQIIAAAKTAAETAQVVAEKATETALAAGQGIKEALPDSNYPNTHERLGEFAGSKVTQATTSGIGAVVGTYKAADATAAAAIAAARATEAGYKKQIGGALTLASMTPSIPVLLFSVGLLAFSGYVFYVFRNTYSNPEKSDDPPREPRAIRKSAERKQ